MQLLVDMTPLKTFSYKNDRGRTPIHSVCACASEAPRDVGQLMVPNPMVSCNQRYAPLHLACKFKASVEVIGPIVRRTPHETSNSEDNDGHGPHYLAWKYNTKEVQQLIRRSKNRLHRGSPDALIVTQLGRGDLLKR